MIQSNEQPTAGNVLAAAKKVITEIEIIESLKGICEQRALAVQYYPASKYHSANMEAVNHLRLLLKDAAGQLNSKSAVKLCLRTELHFHYLAPKSTLKIFTDYHQRLNFWMDACRQILNYRKQ